MRHNLVLGYGISGKSAARFLLDRGEKVSVWDDRQLPVDLPTTQSLAGIDRLIVSPGVPPTHPIYQEAVAKNLPILGEVELALSAVKGPIIGVTGTNGKTTTTLMIAHALNFAGKKAFAAGNVGIPLTSQVNQEGIAVVELSSFQLETMTSPLLHAAVLLNITPDHLDRYSSFEAYAAAKCQIGRCLIDGAPLAIDKTTRHTWDHLLSGVPTTTIEPNSKNSYKSAFGAIVSNEWAAAQVCRQMGVDDATFAAAMTTFLRPCHRMEVVGQRGKITFINDSKATNVDSVEKAVSSLNGPIALIAGGQDKGGDFTSWPEAFEGKVVALYLIGEAAKKIAGSMRNTIPTVMCATLKEAVGGSMKAVCEQGVVLLSPGCASFDMFDNYSDRGDRFKEIVSVI